MSDSPPDQARSTITSPVFRGASAARAMDECIEVFLALPGLNLAPEKLNGLASLLDGKGRKVVIPRLHGLSAAERGEWPAVSAKRWLGDLDVAAEEARARHPGARLSLLGFSMGALLGAAWHLTRGRPLRRMVLICPALRLRGHMALSLHVLSGMLPGRLLLPSLAPAGYRCHPTTSVAAYRALRDLGRIVTSNAPGVEQEDALPPRIVAFVPGDEFVSARHLRAHASRYVERVSLHSIQHRPRRGFPRHLAIDAHTMGPPEWVALQAALEQWLTATAD